MTTFYPTDESTRSTSRNYTSATSFCDEYDLESSPVRKKAAFKDSDTVFLFSKTASVDTSYDSEKSDSSLRFDSKGTLRNRMEDTTTRDFEGLPREIKQPKTMNDSFRDVQQTGRWGQPGKKEVLFVVGLLSMIFVVLVIFLTVLAAAQNDKDSSVVEGYFTPSPTPVSYVVTTEEDKYDAITQVLLQNPVTASYAETSFPDTISDFKELSVTGGLAGDPFLRATEWVLYEDIASANQFFLVQRFALVVIYYANGGENWSHSTDWLSDASVCDWYGVSCHKYVIEELDLSSNNLVGPIADALVLLQDVRSLWLNGNELTGSIKEDVFGQMKSLSFLYLQNNKLTGTVSASLGDNGVLETLYVHGNELKGIWPSEFCTTCEGCPGLQEFGLNCEKMYCPMDCCNPDTNCFE